MILLRHLAPALLLLSVPATAQDSATPATTQQTGFEADRQHILAMAGNYRVRFDMQETTPWQAGYTALDRKTSGGHEVVRVVEDSGTTIRLQHLLVAEHEGRSFVIKHWRQDWTYQPEQVLDYAGAGEWRLVPVPAADRAGAWSQTVWQTDDSPRYGGVGRWQVEAGVPQWTSSRTARPLARRDAVRHPVYDRYLGVNRHAPTINGWIHWQDNTKLTADGTPVVGEFVLNTYARFDGYDVAAADTYWAATADYWAAVRAIWDEQIADDGAVQVTEVAETGSASGAELMRLADEVAAGTIPQADAVARARETILQVTGQQLAANSGLAKAGVPRVRTCSTC